MSEPAAPTEREGDPGQQDAGTHSEELEGREDGTDDLARHLVAGQDSEGREGDDQREVEARADPAPEGQPEQAPQGGFCHGGIVPDRRRGDNQARAVGGNGRGKGAKALFGMRRWLKDRLVDFLNHPVSNYERRGENDVEALTRHVAKGDVLLVEGEQRISHVIKLLTHSTWSHSAVYIGDELLQRGGELRERALEAWGDGAEHIIVEALMDGVVAQPLTKYAHLNVRICRPHKLRPEHLKTIIEDTVAAIGWRYDLRNVVDLAKYFVSVSVFPSRLRRERERMGSDVQTEVICSSLIGQIYQRVGFPVAPTVIFPATSGGLEPAHAGLMRRFFVRRGFEPRGIFHRRHPTLLTPRDFDLSPYFEPVKFNAVADGAFDYEQIQWAHEEAAAAHRVAEVAIGGEPDDSESH